MPIIFMMGITLCIHATLKRYIEISEPYLLEREASIASDIVENGFEYEAIQLREYNYEKLKSVDVVLDLDIDGNISNVQAFDGRVHKDFDTEDFSESRIVKHILSYAKQTGETVFSNVINVRYGHVHMLVIVPRYDIDNEFIGYTAGQICINNLLNSYFGDVHINPVFDYSLKRITYEGESYLYGGPEYKLKHGKDSFKIGDDTFEVCVTYKENIVIFIWLLSSMCGMLITFIPVLVITKLQESVSSRLIYKDTLTEAYNKRMLLKVVEICQRHKKSFCLIFIDIDKFKDINDTYGHIVGDTLLINFVERVLNTVKKKDMLFRVGGDEFILLIEENLSEDTIKNIINRIYRSFDTNLDIVNVSLHVSISAGYSRYPVDSEDIVDLIEIADRNMYREKHDI